MVLGGAMELQPEWWEREESKGWCTHYPWWYDELPTRKFYLFLAEIGRRLRHLMTDPGPIKMIDLCEQCAEGLIDEDQMSDLADEHRPEEDDERLANGQANDMFFWVADRYKVYGDTFCEGLTRIFAVVAAIDAGLLAPNGDWRAVDPIEKHPVFTAAHERTEREWGAVIRDIYGPNPIIPIPFNPDWRTDTAVALARAMYESRDFGAMPILADALQDAGCDNQDILGHCRDVNQLHVRGCWVTDLVLGKS